MALADQSWAEHNRWLCWVDRNIYRIMYVHEWRTVSALTRGSFWCFFPELRSNKFINSDKTTIYAHRSRISLTQFSFCWWRHDRLPIRSEWPDKCDTITWTAISKSLDIDFNHGDIHRRSCKNERFVGTDELIINITELMVLINMKNWFDAQQDRCLFQCRSNIKPRMIIIFQFLDTEQDEWEIRSIMNTVSGRFTFVASVSSSGFAVNITYRYATIIACDDLMTMRHFLLHRFIAWRIHRRLVETPHKEPVMRSFVMFFIVCSNKTLKIHSIGWWNALTFMWGNLMTLQGFISVTSHKRHCKSTAIHFPDSFVRRTTKKTPNYTWLPRCGGNQLVTHDDVIKWKHFPRYWPFVRGIHRSPVNSPHKGQWRGALMFTLICARINVWVNNHEAGDLRRNRVHYDVIVM